MRVQISYSEELENIPGLVEQFLMECGKELLLQANGAGSLTSEKIRDPLQADENLASIDDVRQALAKIDQRLIDASTLLAGYNNAVQGNTYENQEEPEIE